MFCLVFSGPICSHFFKVARPKSASNEVYSLNRREASTAWWERSLPCVTDFEGFPLGNAIFNFRRKSLLYFTTFPRHRSPTFSAGFCQCKKYLTNTASFGKVLLFLLFDSFRLERSCFLRNVYDDVLPFLPPRTPGGLHGRRSCSELREIPDS